MSAASRATFSAYSWADWSGSSRTRLKWVLVISHEIPFLFIGKDSPAARHRDGRGSRVILSFQVWIFLRPILPKSVMTRDAGTVAAGGDDGFPVP